MAKKKITYIQSSGYAMVGRTGGPSDLLGPGDRVLYDPNLGSHVEIHQRVVAGDPAYEHLTIVEVNPDEEQAAEQEKAEMLEKAAEIALEQRNKELREQSERVQAQADADAEAKENGAPSVSDATNLPAVDEEAVRLAEESGAGQRASTQEDVVPEPKPKAKAKPKAAGS